MKVKWIEITKDESTWPPRNDTFLLEDPAPNRACEEQSWGRINLSAESMCKIYGLRWRPMPKPPKKKEPKSPWNKVSHGYPSNGMAILIKKNGVGVSRWTYRFGRKKGEGDFMPIDAVELANTADEWMEIPE